MKWLPLASAGLLLVPEIAIAQEQPAPQTRPGQGQPGRPGGPGVRPPNPGPGHGTRPPITRPPNPGPGVRPPYGGHRPPNFRPIPGPNFRYPHGYRYRRWSIGLLLPSLFLSSAYYFDNYSAYGIYPPPPRHRWVRYGPDLLLVNTRTGRISDVIYGAFR